MRIRNLSRALSGMGLLMPICRQAQSAGMNEFDQGRLVPFASFLGVGLGTAVGVTSKQSGTVHYLK